MRRLAKSTTSAQSEHSRTGALAVVAMLRHVSGLTNTQLKSFIRVYGEDSDTVQVPDDEEGMTAMILDIDARIKRTQANIEAVSGHSVGLALLPIKILRARLFM